MVSVTELTVDYGSFRAVDRVSFSLKKGEIVALAGRNGAGKTSLIKALCGILPGGSSVQIQGKIGYMPERIQPDELLTVEEFLLFSCELQGVKNPKEAVERVSSLCLPGDKIFSRCGHLSRGQIQRVLLAQALLSEPDFLILDEPSNGLDPFFQLELISIIKKCAGDKAVLISSHNIHEIEHLCGRILFLEDGVLVSDEPAGRNLRAVVFQGEISLKSLEVLFPGAEILKYAVTSEGDTSCVINLRELPEDTVFQRAVEHSLVILELNKKSFIYRETDFDSN